VRKGASVYGDKRGAMTVRLAGALFAVLLVIAWLGAGRGIAAPGGEFSNPSPNAPPPASAYNTTPSCPPTAGNNYYCSAPTSSWPPEDASSPERYLNSAYWPAEKRPDVETYAIQQYGYDYQNCSAKMTHYCFLVDAQAVGYPVTHTPQVGDLWLAPGECLAWGSGAALPAGCTDNGSDWYLGYVEQVFPDGSFIQSWGGSDTPADSGIGETWFSGAMDPYTDFIGFFPAGQSPHLPPVQVSVYINTNSSDTGSGSIRDSNGQTCSSGAADTACSFTEPQGVPVTFTATPQSASALEGWEGACSGSGACTVTFNAPRTWLGAEFVAPGSGSGNGVIPGTGGGSSNAGATTHAGTRPRIVGVRTARAMIHATLAGSHLVCKLSLWNRHRWQRPRVARCGTSVTYRHLTAGRYRLTVVSGNTSATKVVILHDGASGRS
jgi:hypothetical protein